MGAVFQATDPSTGQTVAIKTLLQHLADDEAVRRRFQSEIDTLMNLRHPGIARMLAFGEQEGVPFFAMEFVEGRTLEELLRSGRRFSWRETAAVTTEILRSLKYAHDHGVVHRDLKPANLMFPPAPSGGGFHVKLTDFGIARLYGETGHTRSGSVVGTPEYMSPEQAGDLPVDHRADIYCLGLVMVAMMTGGPPFRGPLRDVLEYQRTRRPPRIATLVPDLPPPLDDLIDRMLDKTAANRPANAAVVAHALAEILATVPPPVPRQPATIHASSAQAPPDRGAPTVAVEPPDLGPAKAKAGSRAAGGPHDTTIAIDMAAPPPHARPTLMETGQEQPSSGRSSFTTVESVARSSRDREARAHRMRIVVGSLVAVVTVTGVGIATWSVVSNMLWPSAESQYDRILAVSGNPQDLRDPCSLIKAFLEQHPDDPRAASVREWGREEALERLAKLSRHRFPAYAPKSEDERLYLDAIRSIAADPAAAVQKLRDLVGDPTTPRPAAKVSASSDPCAAVKNPDPSMWRELARRELELVEPLVQLDEKTKREGKKLEMARANGMLQQAARYQREVDDPTTAAARRVVAITRRHHLLQEIVETYADKPLCAEVVAEARKLLAADR
jgi:serine/threonine protein kinase